ncbi:hypothetical protein Mfla_1153 [Methylobacillus flagellatus KT]|uniref:Uncharacterized protein n=1 Tax=Methylobacillus flagellatus (strain ATCC 51484 / DSM 6875 / VKM B-1610 / KT) TaxID=265072 RepID=Q1H266_METFK|nr:hypothetical protein Mfla_1153 [Methylobacillus flagellatus KT]
MDDTLETFVPLTFRRRGARRVAADDRHVHDVTLLEGVARGFYWQHLVDTGEMKSGSEIARAEGLHPSVRHSVATATGVANHNPPPLNPRQQRKWPRERSRGHQRKRRTERRRRGRKRRLRRGGARETKPGSRANAGGTGKKNPNR